MQMGDHLYVPRLGFKHHGIYLGDGSVIEYGGKGAGRMSVRRVRLFDFARGARRVFVRGYPEGTTLSPEETVALAFERLHEQDYDVFNNNCEHLAYWCKTGRHLSPQADSLKGAVQVAAVVAAAVAIADVTERVASKK